MCCIQKCSAWEMLLGVSHLWFLMTIFECYIIGLFFKPVLYYCQKQKYNFVLCCCLVIVLTVHWNLPTRFLTIERVFHYFPFYLIGMIAGSIDLNQLAKYQRLMLVLLGCACVLLPIQNAILHKAMADQLIGLFVVIPLFFLLRTTSLPACPCWLLSLDKHSMRIYIIHQILQQEINKVTVFHSLMIQHEYAYPIF